MDQVDQVSMSLELGDNINENRNDDEEQEEDDRQQELNGLLSTAFDDLSSVSSEDEDEIENEEAHDNMAHKILTNGIKTPLAPTHRAKQYDYGDNSLNWSLPKNMTSTPRILNSNGHEYHHENNHKKRYFINDVIDEENDFTDSLGLIDKENLRHMSNGMNGFDHGDNESLESRNSSLENARRPVRVNELGHGKTNGILSEERIVDDKLNHSHVQLLLDENQRLNNEVMIGHQRLSAAKGDFNGLEFKYKELEKMNSLKDKELARLEGRMKSLEMQVNVEREAKEEVQRKLTVADSSIESLQFQLMEVGRSDCLVRAKETHEAIINQIKKKHEVEMTLLRGEVDGMRHELEDKYQEIAQLENQITQLNREKEEISFDTQVKEMVEMTRNMWEKELKSKMEKNYEEMLEMSKATWTRRAEENACRAKRAWESELQRMIDEIVRRIKVKAKMSVDNWDHECTLHWRPMLELWNSLEESYEEKEKLLLNKTEELRDARRQLEEALMESKINENTTDNLNVSSSSAHARTAELAILNEIKNELSKVKEETNEMKHKLHKYKQHYHQLDKKHKLEIERLQTQFAKVLSDQLVTQNLK